MSTVIRQRPVPRDCKEYSVSSDGFHFKVLSIGTSRLYVECISHQFPIECIPAEEAAPDWCDRDDFVVGAVWVYLQRRGLRGSIPAAHISSRYERLDSSLVPGTGTGSSSRYERLDSSLVPGTGTGS